MQFDKRKKHKERKNKIPSKKNTIRIFPLRLYSLRGSKDKMAALYLTAGEGLRAAHKQLGKPTVFQALQDVLYLSFEPVLLMECMAE